MKNLTNYYDILGVSPQAEQEEIMAAAKALSARFPAEARDPQSNPAYRQLVEAYDTLSTPEKRAAYDEKRARLGQKMNVSVQLSRNVIGAIENAQVLYALLDVRAPTERQETAERMPVNICLVVDRSTSMQGARLEQVRAAARLAVQQLDREDVLSVVSFSDRAEVLSPAGHLHNRGVLARRMDELRAGGGTEIYQGLKAGLQEMSNVDLRQYVNKLILLTDGHTYGDEQECIQLAQDAANRGVTLSALGLGTDWNDQFLDRLVAPSSGQATFIEKPEQIIDCLQEQIDGVGAVYAQNVHLSLELPAGVTLQYAMKLAPFAQPLSRHKNVLRLGTVEGRSPLSVLLEFQVQPLPTGHSLHIPLRLQGKVPARPNEELVFAEEMKVDVVLSPGTYLPPPVIIRAVQMLNLYRMNEQVWEDVEAGRLDDATRRMRRLSTRLMESGQSKLAYEAIVETQRLTRMGTLSQEGRKKLKFGTRSLLTKTISLNDYAEV